MPSKALGLPPQGATYSSKSSAPRALPYTKLFNIQQRPPCKSKLTSMCLYIAMAFQRLTRVQWWGTMVLGHLEMTNQNNKTKQNKTRGVSHLWPLPFTFQSILRQKKKNYGNSNIFTMQK